MKHKTGIPVDKNRIYPIFNNSTESRFEVEFYRRSDGIEPAKDFLLSLGKKMRAKMMDMIALLQDNGYELREPYSKHLSDGIFELRAKVGSDSTRVLFFFYVNRRIILTNGFIKKTQKIPWGELEKAKKYRSDFMEQRGER